MTSIRAIGMLDIAQDYAHLAAQERSLLLPFISTSAIVIGVFDLKNEVNKRIWQANFDGFS